MRKPRPKPKSVPKTMKLFSARLNAHGLDSLSITEADVFVMAERDWNEMMEQLPEWRRRKLQQRRSSRVDSDR